MNQQNAGSIWLAIAVLIVGLGSLFLLGIQPSRNIALVNIGGQLNATPKATPLPTPAANVATTPTPAPTRIPLPPLALPAVPVPTAGQVFLLTPQSAEMVGWAQADDEKVNHLGDYNIYAGVFDDKQHVGAMQFDVSSIPPGSPILYADLTLTGLSTEWLVAQGEWTAQMLAPWLDKDWKKQTFHWLAREDSGMVLLDTQVGSADLAIGKPNTFFLSAEGLALLEARLFTGKVSFRMRGPSTGDNNLFGWDSGFGAQSMGRPPVLRIVTGGPAPAQLPPSPTPNYVIITPTPADGPTLFALAAERLTVTAQATPVPVNGTPGPTETFTPLPPNWVTPSIITNTPIPTNAATVAWQKEVATARAIVRGTATETPPNVWTATATPWPPPATSTPLIVDYISLTPTPTPSDTPVALPAILRGKILFYSDRNGENTKSLMVMDADGGNLAFWTEGEPKWIYERATLPEDLSPDGQHRVVVSKDQINNLQLWSIDLTTNTRLQLTQFNADAYEPVWSPVGNLIAFVSPELGNDEIFLVSANGGEVTRLTSNQWEWDKHPSWSPDGRQIVFWSNRETQREQIWIMNADGSNQRNLSNNEFNDWDPVWVK